MFSVRALISKNGADHYGNALFLLIISITIKKHGGKKK